MSNVHQLITDGIGPGSDIAHFLLSGLSPDVHAVYPTITVEMIFNSDVHQLITDGIGPGSDIAHFLLSGLSPQGAVSTRWTDVSSDVLQAPGLALKYGMPDGLPGTRVASAGEAAFALKNSTGNLAGQQGYYSPHHASVRSGFKQNIPVRISFTFNGTTYYKFVGRLKTISPTPGRYGPQSTQCTVTDYFDDLARSNVSGLSPQISKRFDEVLTTLVAAMPYAPLSTSYDAGVAALPYAMVGGSGGLVNGLQEAQRLAMSEWGYIYMKGDTVAGGKLRAENRYTRLLNGTVSMTLADTDLFAIDVPSSVTDLFNQVEVTIHPRRVDAAPVVLYSSLSTPAIPAGGTITVQGSYSDPTLRNPQLAPRVAGIAMQALVAGTDYAANSAPDASGTDLTSSITVTPTFSGTGVTLQITNGGATTAYVTLLQCRGIGLYDYDPALMLASDATSQSTNGVCPYRIDMPYQADPLVGNGVAAYVRDQWRDPFDYARKVSFLANKNVALMTAALERDIGDRIAVSETMTGVNREFWIHGIELHVLPGKILTCTWTLAPAKPAVTGVWELGVAGKSEVGETTTLWPYTF